MTAERVPGQQAFPFASPARKARALTRSASCAAKAAASRSSAYALAASTAPMLSTSCAREWSAAERVRARTASRRAISCFMAWTWALSLLVSSTSSSAGPSGSVAGAAGARLAPLMATKLAAAAWPCTRSLEDMTALGGTSKPSNCACLLPPPLAGLVWCAAGLRWLGVGNCTTLQQSRTGNLRDSQQCPDSEKGNTGSRTRPAIA